MEVETGFVINLKGRMAVVQLESGDQCAVCGSKASCDAKGLNTRQITISNPIDAEVGDKVQISYHSKTRFLSGLLIFIFPVILGFTGYFFAHSRYGSEGAGIIGTFTGFVLAFVIIWAVNWLLERKQYVPTILKVEV